MLVFIIKWFDTILIKYNGRYQYTSIFNVEYLQGLNLQVQFKVHFRI